MAAYHVSSFVLRAETYLFQSRGPRKVRQAWTGRWEGFPTGGYERELGRHGLHYEPQSSENELTVCPVGFCTHLGSGTPSFSLISPLWNENVCPMPILQFFKCAWKTGLSHTFSWHCAQPFCAQLLTFKLFFKSINKGWSHWLLRASWYRIIRDLQNPGKCDWESNR